MVSLLPYIAVCCGITLAATTPIESSRFSNGYVGLLSHKLEVFSVAWSSNGKFVASSSNDNTIKVYDMGQAGKAILELKTNPFVDGSPVSVAFSPDSSKLAIGCGRGRVAVMTLATKSFTLLRGLDRVAKSIRFSHDGRMVAVGSTTKAMVWDLAAGTSFRLPTDAAVESIDFSPDDRALAGACDDGHVRVWELSTRLLRIDIENAHPGGALAVAFAPQGGFLYSGGEDKDVAIYDLALNSIVKRIGHDDAVKTVAFSADGKYFASGSADKKLRIFTTGDLADPRLQTTMIGHTDEVNSVAFSPGAKALVSGSKDKTVRVWEVGTGKLRGEL